MEGISSATAETLRPAEPPVRRVGPGRLELGYQRRIAELERGVGQDRAQRSALELELAGARGQLSTAARLERGLQRLADKLEQRIETAEQREKRLILALGSLQKENELLRRRLALGRGVRAPVLLAAAEEPQVRAARRARSGAAAGPRAGFLARILGSRRSP